MTHGAVPTFENGDTMSRFEFRRRYEAHPEIRLAQLIERRVYIAGRVTVAHGTANAAMVGWLVCCTISRPNLEASIRPTTVLDLDNEVQPDTLLRRVEGGTCRVGDDGYLQGPPELVVDVAASSVSIDLHDKMRAYRRNGVGEYIVWRTEDNVIDWFELREGDYVRREPGKDGMIESAQFPGLRLDVPAMLAHDLSKVAAAVR